MCCRPAGCRATARRCPSSPTSFDFSVYIDADEVGAAANGMCERWLTLRDTAFTDPKSYFHRYALLSDDEAIATANRDLGAHQPRQSRGQHPADPAARDADPEEGRRSRHRDGGAAAAVVARRVARREARAPHLDAFTSGRWARFRLRSLRYGGRGRFTHPRETATPPDAARRRGPPAPRRAFRGRAA